VNRSLPQLLRRSGEKVASAAYLALLAATRAVERWLLCEFALRTGRGDYVADPAIVKTLRYKTIDVAAHVQCYWDYARMRIYEMHPVERIERDLLAGGRTAARIVYYEIGCNVGYSALVIGKLLEDRGEVFAFEVEPANFKTLVDNVLLNGLTNVTPLQLGVAQETGLAKFYFNRYHDRSARWPSSGMGMHSLSAKADVHDPRCYYRVPVMPLDRIIEVFALPAPTHVFIDAYGSEDSIIAGMEATLRRHELQVVMVDIEPGPPTASAAHKRLCDAGFELVESVMEEAVDVVPTSFKCTYVRPRDRA
jgi:FkbM family methyltransferase